MWTNRLAGCAGALALLLLVFAQFATTKRAAGEGPHAEVPRNAIDRETLCAIGRGRRCDIGLAVARGLFETGLWASFPDGLNCRSIDEAWAISYTHKRNRESYHGGIDMPAPFGTPIVAAAAGTVIAKYDGERSYRGIEITLRHTPAESGLPVFVYTQYAHFDAMPEVEVGERVARGEVLGPTGNSGIAPKRRRSGRERRPAIHFAVWFSESPHYHVGRRNVIPANGRWMDPVALYRLASPYDSRAVKALPDDEKQVIIPAMAEDGEIFPPDSKLVWPYRCQRD